VKDSSLKVSPGVEGVVIDVKIFSRVEDQVVEKDRGERIGEVRRLEGEEKVRVNDVRDDEIKAELLVGQKVSLALQNGTVEEAIPAGTTLTEAMLRDLRLDRRSTSRRSASRTRRPTSGGARDHRRGRRGEGAHRGEGRGADRPHPAAG
jgi:DNA-directed RNA polymerase beta subunit